MKKAIFAVIFLALCALAIVAARAPVVVTLDNTLTLLDGGACSIRIWVGALQRERYMYFKTLFDADDWLKDIKSRQNVIVKVKE